MQQNFRLDAAKLGNIRLIVKQERTETVLTFGKRR